MWGLESSDGDGDLCKVVRQNEGLQKLETGRTWSAESGESGVWRVWSHIHKGLALHVGLRVGIAGLEYGVSL